jgi:hypothetical protein
MPQAAIASSKRINTLVYSGSRRSNFSWASGASLMEMWWLTIRHDHAALALVADSFHGKTPSVVK